MSLSSLKVRTALTLKPNAVPSSPENGDIYYDSTANLFYFYQNGAWVSYSTSGSRANGTATTISSGVTSVVVTFSTALSNANYAVTANFKNTVDANPQFQPIVITAQSASGFTATWNAPLETVNYILEYVAIPNV